MKTKKHKHTKVTLNCDICLRLMCNMCVYTDKYNNVICFECYKRSQKQRKKVIILTDKEYDKLIEILDIWEELDDITLFKKLCKKINYATPDKMYVSHKRK